MICDKCGCEVLGNVNNCPKCGNLMNNNEMNINKKIKKVEKCPNCGEIIDAYATKCKTCGYELRNIDATSSVSELANKLDDLNKNLKDCKVEGIFSFFNRKSYEEQIFDEKIENITNFPIPNTREDILEFMFLSSSNIRAGKHKSDHELSEREKELSDAWFSKMEQAYHKACATLKNDPYFEKIEIIYKTKQNEFKKFNRNKLAKKIINACVTIVILVLCISPLAWLLLEKNNLDSKLDRIYNEIQIDIKEGRYDEALIKANELRYSRIISDSAADDWDEKRETIISLINDKKRIK